MTGGNSQRAYRFQRRVRRSGIVNVSEGNQGLIRNNGFFQIFLQYEGHPLLTTEFATIRTGHCGVAESGETDFGGGGPRTMRRTLGSDGRTSVTYGTATGHHGKRSQGEMDFGTCEW